MAAIANYPKLKGPKRHKCINFQSWRSCLNIMVLVASWRLSINCCLSSSRDACIHGSCLHLQSQDAASSNLSHFFPSHILTLTHMPPSYKETRAHPDDPG